MTFEGTCPSTQSYGLQPGPPLWLSEQIQSQARFQVVQHGSFLGQEGATVEGVGSDRLESETPKWCTNPSLPKSIAKIYIEETMPPSDGRS